jgi:uncharacterized repeat protein (TIGR01451 family)
MLGSKRQHRGQLAAVFSFCSVLILASCSEAPLKPGNENYSVGVPLATLSTEFDQYQFLGFVTDDQLANDTPAQSDLNAFTRADNVSGKIGVKWVWDDINSWTGTGQTGDACALFDTDGDTKANAAVCVRISNPNADPTLIAQLAPPASPLVYSCGDSKADRCASPNRLVALNGTHCEVEKITGETFFAEGEDGADVLAACSIPFAAIGATSAPNLLNVCSYPSGSPGSNAFDCVVTPGTGFIIIKKATTPQNSGQTFSFTISPALVSGASQNLTDNTTGVEETSLLSALPGSSYSVTESALPTGWQLNAASCARQTSPNPTATGTRTGLAVNAISVTQGETTVCTFTNAVAAPSISVTKTPTPATIPETGGTVSYTVVVTNNSTIPVTLTSLNDDVFGDLSTQQGTCNKTTPTANPYGSIAPAGTYTCTFSEILGASEPNQTHVNTVTANVSSDGGAASASDDATVTYTNVDPSITVTKSADTNSFSASGGTSVDGFTANATYTGSGGGGGSGTPSFYGNICDDGLANDVPAQSDLNCFSRADNVADRLWVRWTWDDINAWTGTGQTGDACSLLDTDNDGNANFAICVRIMNPNGDPTQIAQLDGSPILYKCGDDLPDRCTAKNSVVSLTASDKTVCTITSVPDQMAGGEDGADIQATCDVRLRDLGPTVAIANIDLLNVCSFPSGAPNSNAFDCVVTPAAGFLVIAETTTPASSSAYFGFRLRNASYTAAAAATNHDSAFSVQAGATSSGIPVLPGTYSLGQLMPTGWSLNTVTCTRDGSTIANGTASPQSNITIVQGSTTTCTFNNSVVASQTITFTVTVTNNSLEAVTLYSLEDTENPSAGTPTYVTLNGVGYCATGGSIANGTPYICTFTRTVSGTAGTTHNDRVRAVGRDNESTPNSDTKESSIVTVTIN